MNINRISLSRKEDVRGWLIENESSVIRSSMRHFLVSVSKPDIIRGQHYHKRKTEWFLVIKGKATIYFKDVNSLEEKNIKVDGDSPEIVAVSPMVAHAIRNTGKEDLYLLVIVSEPLDPKDQDTFVYKVISG